MSIQRARTHLAAFGLAESIQELAQSSATVELAAQALGTQPERIAKSLTFRLEDRVLLIVAAGDAKVDNSRYKQQFGGKAHMLAFDEVEPLVGHAVGGVCPFGVEPGVEVYLDASLRRFGTVFPACGSSNSAIELTLEQLEQTAAPKGWVDVCKNWREEEKA